MLNLLYVISFSGLGVSILRFVVGPFSILYFSLILCRLFQLKFYSRTIRPFIILMSVFTFSNIGRNDLESYFLSLTVFILSCSIVLINPVHDLKNIEKRLEKLTIYSFVIMAFFCLVEFTISIAEREIWDVFSRLILQNGGVNSYFGIYRIRAGTMEPSILGIFLVFYLILFMFYLPLIYNKTYSTYVLVTLLLIGLTMSTTAILGAAVIILIKIFLKFTAALPRLMYLRLKKSLFSFDMIFFCLAIISLTIIDGAFVEKMLDRIFKIFVVISSLKIGSLDEAFLMGSVGFRVGSLFVMLDYLSDASLVNILFGEGYSNFDRYLMQHFGHIERSGLSRGQPGNIITALVLGTGMLGTTCYFYLLARVVIYRFDSYALVSVTYILLFLLSTGNIGSVTMWYLIYLIGLLNRYSTQIRAKN